VIKTISDSNGYSLSAACRLVALKNLNYLPMKAMKYILLITAGLFLMSSCTKYPVTDSRLTEDLVIYTKYDTKTDFTNYKTYSIPDSIGYIDAKDSGKVMNSYTKAIISSIDANMKARNFVKVLPNEHPDFGFNLVVIKNTNVSVYYPGWYWGYPGYYPAGYWYYPNYYYWYPYYPTYITSYSSGSLIGEMVDLKYPSDDNKLYIRWNLYIRALLTGSHTVSEVQNSINQAFIQTPAIATK
jgi:hypothetical protein